MITLSESGRAGHTILIVDDDPGARELLRTTLTADGYRVVLASRGEEALAGLGSSPPDVVLLDVAMPGVNGIEVCRKIHADPETAHIPVILVTAHRRREIMLDGIAAGAREFLLKPLDLADLRVRVRNACEMKRLYDESEARFRKISELEALRDSLVHMIVHDLKSPLTTVMGNLQLMELCLPAEVDPDLRSAVNGCTQGAHRMNDLVTSILGVSKLESGEMELSLEESALFDVVEEARSLLGIRSSRVQLSEDPPPGGVRVSVDVGLVQRVVTNLLTNALEHSPEDCPVSVRVYREDSLARVDFADRGSGIPEEFREKIFEKFGQVSSGGKKRKGSVGLGLTFCKLAVEAHGGRIGVESRAGGGSVFWFALPMG